MKRVIFTLICGIIATSCWQVTEYEPPRRTQFASEMFDDIATNITDNTDAVELALRLDSWRTATDVSHKDLIEDTYFSFYKLRTSGDTIRLSQSTDYHAQLISVITRGTSLKSVGSRWSITLDNQTLDVECTATNQWSLTCSDFRTSTLSTELIYTTNSLDNQATQYKVEGRGFTTMNTYYEGYNGRPIEYTIDRALKISYNLHEYYLDSTSFDNYDSNMACESGMLLCAIDKLEGAEYTSKITILGSRYYMITYRGFTEKYGYDPYNGYYSYDY